MISFVRIFRKRLTNRARRMMPRRWRAVDRVMLDRKLRTLDIGNLQGEYSIENMEIARLSAGRLGGYEGVQKRSSEVGGWCRRNSHAWCMGRTCTGSHSTNPTYRQRRSAARSRRRRQARKGATRAKSERHQEKYRETLSTCLGAEGRNRKNRCGNHIVRGYASENG